MGVRAKFVGALAVFSALTLTGTGAALAHGLGRTWLPHTHRQWTMAGLTTCPLHFWLQLSPPLTATPTTSPTTVTFAAASLKGCTNRAQGNVEMVRGHLSSLTGTLSTGATCLSFLEGLAAPELAGGSVTWAPASRIAGSTGVTFPQGTLEARSNDMTISYSAGAVDGSYATASSALVSATSSYDVPTLSLLCGTGLGSIAFTGSIDL